jgi:glucuronosyltransferase
VIRHKGAPHLRSAVLDLAWYQYFLLDVITLLAIAIVSLLLIMFLVCRVILKKLFKRKTQEENKESRRNKEN